jgi:O-antigen ligase
MPQLPVVRWAALFWGFAAFFPIGLNYAAFIGLALAMAWQGGWPERLARLRQTPNWWPSWLFVGWTALVLAFGPAYPETPSNALHALRIVLTLWLALALARDEAVWALRGFGLGLAASLALVALNETVGLPPGAAWDSIIRYGGNKSLANAVLMALAAGTGLLLMPILSARQRLGAAVLSLGALGVLVWVLHSRTAWLIVLACAVAGLLHQLRARRQEQVLAVALAAALTLGAGLLVPGVKDRVALGVKEIASAYEGHAVDAGSSWGIRFRMYSETAAMVRDQPLWGWGIGGWSAQWKQRVEPALADSNMPHNDFLWMGAQAGLPGALLLLWLVAAGLPAAWRRHDLSGRLGVAALLTMLIAVATNSALRDASIGLSLWFIALVYQRLSTEPESVWLEALPGGRPAGPA